jgi:hypothetical protein
LNTSSSSTSYSWKRNNFSSKTDDKQEEMKDGRERHFLLSLSWKLLDEMLAWRESFSSHFLRCRMKGEKPQSFYDEDSKLTYIYLPPRWKERKEESLSHALFISSKKKKKDFASRAKMSYHSTPNPHVQFHPNANNIPGERTSREPN